MVACLCAVASAAEMVKMADKVGVVLHNLKTQHIPAQRRSGYEATLLATENVQGFFICHIINYTGYNQK